ncbi:NifB/NifX family molybdenum-iron cluster-binding protein [candidate division WOR-3 bacterium]|nr:NifB/NifX family molybdenum-iron cluster-binding protein [candidate division WOR-3 bacterium]
MKVAVATDAGLVSAHFGRCSEYTLAEIENGKVVKTEKLVNPGHEPGFLPGFLAGYGVRVVICGGAGPRALALFAEKGIEMRMGVSGPVDAVLGQFATGELAAGDSTCDHGSLGDGRHEHHH